MGYLLVILVCLLVGALGWATMRPVAAFAESTNQVQTAGPAPTAAPTLDRETLTKRLKELAKGPAPKNLKFGALCYSTLPAPERFEYLCPICGEKTLYALADKVPGNGMATRSLQEDALWELKFRLTSYRRTVRELKGISVKLDESQFCRKCRPDVKDPKPVLVVQLKGEDEIHRIDGITEQDLLMLRDFLKGKTTYATLNDGTAALKDSIPRLAQILGIQLDSGSEK